MPYPRRFLEPHLATEEATLAECQQTAERELSAEQMTPDSRRGTPESMSYSD